MKTQTANKVYERAKRLWTLVLIIVACGSFIPEHMYPDPLGTTYLLSLHTLSLFVFHSFQVVALSTKRGRG